MPDDHPTLAALLTPPAPGAIAVVALSGPRAAGILSGVLRAAKSSRPAELVDRRPTLCRIVDGEETVDDAVVVRIDSEGSGRFEISVHGGVRIVQRVLMLLERLGARVVPGEAFALGAEDAVQGAIDAALLKAQSRRLAEWLLRQRTILPGYLANHERRTPSDLAAFRRRSQAAMRLLAGLRVAIIGPPNAGKSTLANRLIGADRVITADEPGTTRDWVSETALIVGWPVTLTDTAGLRETDCAIEAEAIRRGGEQATRAELVMVVLDATAPPAEQSAALERCLRLVTPDQPRIVVLNKCDDPAARFVAAGGADACRISARHGAGMDILERRIEAMLELDLLGGDQPTAVSTAQIPGDQAGGGTGPA